MCRGGDFGFAILGVYHHAGCERVSGGGWNVRREMCCSTNYVARDVLCCNEMSTALSRWESHNREKKERRPTRGRCHRPGAHSHWHAVAMGWNPFRLIFRQIAIKLGVWDLQSHPDLRLSLIHI